MCETIYRKDDPSRFRYEWDAMRQKCMYRCPETQYTHEVDSDADGATACDPAFITYDRAWPMFRQLTVERRDANDSLALDKISAEVEKSLAKALDEAGTTERAWSVAIEVWRSSVSSAFQRQALALVRSVSKSPADAETLGFMLSALDNPSAQMDRCRELGRGTPLERKTAADRLALLLQNPNLADCLK